MLVTVLLVILILALLGALPVRAYPWYGNWGYAPSGLLGIVLVILLVLFLLGRI